MMWYVEAVMNWQTKTKERWEGLTKEQSREVHQKYYDAGVPLVVSGRMNDC